MAVLTAEPRVSRMSPAVLAWTFMRVSGVLLLALAGGHLLIMHYLKAPSETTTQFVGGRWSSGLWLAFDGLLLLVALLHGSVGLQTMLSDVNAPRRARVLGNCAIAALAGLFLAIGLPTLLIFDPERLASGRGPLSDQAWLAEALTVLLFGLATITYLGALAVALRILWRVSRGQPLGAWSLPGHWAWTLHRLTGVGMLGFLLVHILDVALVPLAPDVYDQTVKAYAHPYLVPMEIALVGAVLFHALNGARLIALDLWEERARKHHALLLRGVFGLSLALLVPSVLVLLRGLG